MGLKIDGRDFKVNNEVVRFYPISRLAKEMKDAGMPRDIQTLRKWEAKKVIPPIIFRPGFKRMYTMEQIMAIVETAKECGIRQGLNHNESNFRQRIWDRLTEINNQYLDN